MTKDKKKNAKKDKKQEDVLDNTARTLKKFRRVTKHLTKLTTGQKVVGGVALVAAGLVYLAKKQNEASATAHSTDAAAAEASLSALITGPNEPEAALTDGPSTAESSTPAPAAPKKSKKRK